MTPISPRVGKDVPLTTVLFRQTKMVGGVLQVQLREEKLKDRKLVWLRFPFLAQRSDGRILVPTRSLSSYSGAD